jgi:TatD DNase family protein
MILTDTHTHLYLEDFKEDIEAVMARAIQADIQRFFLPAIDSSYTNAMLQLQQQYPEHIFLMAGLHPTHVKEDNYEEEIAHVEQLLQTGKYCAVGEIGIDLYWDTSTLELQKTAFKRQIQLAKAHNLPIVIHCREAFQEIFEVLEALNDDQLFGIFHCFTGTLEDAKRAITLGFKLGIGGVVTFKNGKIDQFLDQIDLKHLVLETDAPYLAPVPYRGKRNESAYLERVIIKLEAIYQLPKEEIAQITTENSKQLFKV